MNFPYDIINLNSMPTLANLFSTKPRFINHRGAGTPNTTIYGIRPENTSSGFDFARNKESECIEIDVVMTSDGVPVIIHDSTFDRTANAQYTGDVANTKYDDLCVAYTDIFIDSSLNKNEKRIMPLSEYLYEYSMEAPTLIELKVYTVALATKVANMITERGLEDYICISCFNFTPLDTIYAINPNIMLAYNSSTVTDIATLQSHHIDIAHISSTSGITAQNVADYQAAGMKCIIWTVDDWYTANNLINMGVDGITSNYANYIKWRYSGDYDTIPTTKKTPQLIIGNGYSRYIPSGAEIAIISGSRIGWTQTISDSSHRSIGFPIKINGLVTNRFRIQFTVKCEKIDSAALTSYFGLHFFESISDGFMNHIFSAGLYYHNSFYFNYRSTGVGIIGFRGVGVYKDVLVDNTWSTWTTGSVKNMTVDVVVNSATSITITVTDGIKTMSQTIDTNIPEFANNPIPMQGGFVFSGGRHAMSYTYPQIIEIPA